MIRRIAKLLFVVTLWTAALTIHTAPVQARDATDWCDCYWGFAYIYSIGPWYYIDQEDIAPSATQIPETVTNKVEWCFWDCYNYTLARAENLCNTYGFENKHFQLHFSYFFLDGDWDDGGNVDDTYNTNDEILMCGDYF